MTYLASELFCNLIANATGWTLGVSEYFSHTRLAHTINDVDVNNVPITWKSRLDAALWYAERGLHPFPCYEIGPNGRCACGKADCKDAGKHPRIGKGHNAATTDPEKIRDWWTKWPNANIGIAAGNGLFVIDIDPRNGGNESFAQLEAELGELPKLFVVRTGSGGRQIYLRMPDGVILRSKNGVRPGIDIRGEGGYVIAPPSNHKTGGVYVWEQMEIGNAG